jgi:hypothetical protein
MVGKPVSGRSQRAGARTRSGVRRARVPLAAASAFALCVAAAMIASGPASAGSAPASAARPEPPTAAEARAWEERFLRGEGPAAARLAAPASAKRAGRRLFPQNRVLSLYGAAGGFGVLGRKSLEGASRKLREQLGPYRKRSRKPVISAFDLVAVIATRCEDRRDKCRVRVSEKTIDRYLQGIRALNGRLILDIQPGRASVLDEIDHLKPFLREPDVDVAIDAEWTVGRSEHPGEDQGTIRAERINEAIAKIRGIQKRHDLPPKLLVIHQFQRESVKHRPQIKRPDAVDVTINFDGIGSPPAKRAGYRTISTSRFFNGFSLFYRLDQDLMSPQAVLGLEPSPHYVMYQ